MAALDGKKEKLISEFTLFCFKHPEISLETLSKTFFKNLSQDDKDFLVECWDLCVGSAEAARSAPKGIQCDIQRLSATSIK